MILEARAILNTDKIQRLVKRFRDILEDDGFEDDDLREVMCCASLAHHGLLSSFKEKILFKIDLSPVPAQHLASLASCATRYFQITNVSGCDLVSILTSLKCETLFISMQSLEREETRALVQAMESVVEMLWLYDEATLDIEALSEYSGQGVCRRVTLYGDTWDRYSDICSMLNLEI